MPDHNDSRLPNALVALVVLAILIIAGLTITAIWFGAPKV